MDGPVEASPGGNRRGEGAPRRRGRNRPKKAFEAETESPRAGFPAQDLAGTSSVSPSSPTELSTRAPEFVPRFARGGDTEALWIQTRSDDRSPRRHRDAGRNIENSAGSGTSGPMADAEIFVTPPTTPATSERSSFDKSSLLARGVSCSVADMTRECSEADVDPLARAQSAPARLDEPIDFSRLSSRHLVIIFEDVKIHCRRVSKLWQRLVDEHLRVVVARRKRGQVASMDMSRMVLLLAGTHANGRLRFPHLEVVHLGGENICSLYTKALQAVLSNNVLRELTINASTLPIQELRGRGSSCTDVQLTGLSLQDAALVGELVQLNSALQRLTLNSFEMDVRKLRGLDGDTPELSLADELPFPEALLLGTMLRPNHRIRTLRKGAVEMQVQLLTGSAGDELVNLCLKNLRDEHACIIGAILPGNTSLVELRLMANQIGDQGCTALAWGIKASPQLQFVCLRGNSIGDAGATALADAVRESAHLAVLDLRTNKIGDSGATYLAESVRRSSSLESLALSSNRIGDPGAVELAEAVCDSAVISFLDLESNKITDLGARAFAQALQNTPNLSHLYLGSNVIEDKGATALGDAAKVAPWLRELWLARNKLTKQGILHLDKCKHACQNLSLIYASS